MAGKGGTRCRGLNNRWFKRHCTGQETFSRFLRNFAAVKVGKNPPRRGEQNIAPGAAQQTLREKKNNFAWETLRYSQTFCSMNKPPALETWRFRAEKIALATKTCANRHNTCGLIIVHYERHMPPLKQMRSARLLAPASVNTSIALRSGTSTETLPMSLRSTKCSSSRRR